MIGIDNPRKRQLPVVVGEQQLRNLRHKDGHTSVRGVFATCPHCISGQFTHEELVETYLINGKKVAGLTKFPERSTRRLNAMCIEAQKPENTDEVDASIVNAP